MITQLICGETKGTGICFLRLSPFFYTTVSGWMALNVWFSTSSSSLTWEHVINANSEAPLQTY